MIFNIYLDFANLALENHFVFFLKMNGKLHFSVNPCHFSRYRHFYLNLLIYSEGHIYFLNSFSKREIYRLIVSNRVYQ